MKPKNIPKVNLTMSLRKTLSYVCDNIQIASKQFSLRIENNFL